MTYVIRIALGAIALGLAVASFAHFKEAYDLSEPHEETQLDLSSNPELYDEWAEIDSRNQARRADYETAHREFENTGELYAQWAFVSALLFVFICIPWDRVSDSIAEDIRAGKARNSRLRMPTRKPKQGPNLDVGRKLNSMSVADELLKWQKLRDDGVVDAATFERAKKKLLGETDGQI